MDLEPYPEDKGWVSIQKVEPKPFVLQFFKEVDKKRILESRLWCFDSYLLLI